MASKISQLSSVHSDKKQTSIEKKQKENSNSSRDKTKKKRLTSPRSSKSPERKSNLSIEIKNSSKRHIKTEMEEIEKAKSSDKDHDSYEFSASFFNDEQKPVRNTIHIPPSGVKKSRTTKQSRVVT